MDLKAVKPWLGAHLGHAVAGLPIGMAAYSAYQQGENIPAALAKSTFANTWPMLVTAGLGKMGGPAAFAITTLLPMAPGVVTGIHGSLMNRAQYFREAGRSFSHRTEHSQFAYQCMQSNMQTMAGSQGLGTEAARMAQRYGK